MAFFDTSQDLDLLSASVRSDPDLAIYAQIAEREVLLRYQIRTGINTYEIALEGYDDTTPDNSEATLKTALKHAIARVLSFRLNHKDEDSSIRRVKLADWEMERQSGQGQDSTWPSGWSNELDEFYREKPVWYYI